MGMLNWSNALSAAGGAAAAVGLEGVRATLDQQKIELADKLAGARELAADGRREAAATARDARAFTSDKALADARRTFETEQNNLNRTLTRDQIAANERTHRLDRENATAIAKMGGVIHTDPDGNVTMIGKDGKAQQIMDPRDPTKPLKSAKDLTPAAKAYADVIKDRLKAIESNQLMPPEEKDKRIATLNEELLKVVTGGIGALAKSDAPTTGKTGWDPATGEVWKNGESIGKAKSADEARSLIHTPAAPAGQGLMNDPLEAGDREPVGFDTVPPAGVSESDTARAAAFRKRNGILSQEDAYRRRFGQGL